MVILERYPPGMCVVFEVSLFAIAVLVAQWDEHDIYDNEADIEGEDDDVFTQIWPSKSALDACAKEMR